MFQLEIQPPAEMNSWLDSIRADLGHCDPLETFRRRWQTAHERFGRDPVGELAYRDAWLYFQEKVHPLVRRKLTAESEGRQAARKIAAIFEPDAPPQRINRQMVAHMRQQRLEPTRPGSFLKPTRSDRPDFDRPIFIVSAPRAGSSLLFETLARFAEVWTIGQESHDIEADLPALHPATHAYASNRLTAAEATPAVRQAMGDWFGRRLQDREGRLYQALPAEKRPAAVRFLEKTPKNALRIPFLKAIFPDARFIYLYREPRQNISSMLEGWRSRRFVAYRGLPGWPYKEWSFLLVPGWEQWFDKPLVEIAAYQWQITNETIRADLQPLPTDCWHRVDYEALINRPAETIKRISDFAAFSWTAEIAERLARPLPVSHMAVSPPAADKWRKYEAEIKSVLPVINVQ